jgi:uncharacterized membrane protein
MPARPTLRVPDLSAIDWERWLGVRGAAVLGGVVLALAGLFFFRYSIEHGLIPPWLRIVIGSAVGIGCLFGSERFVRARHAALADALAGAGMVILYGAFWAARSLYALIGPMAAFTGMIATTAAGTALAWRHASLVIALLGLAGGFATPLLLASRIENPIGLFAYLLLLDVGVLVLAIRRRWPLLAIASLVATVLYQLLFVGWQMGPERIALALAILGVFALVFAAAGRMAPAEQRSEYLLTQAGGALFPFGFAFYFAANARLDVSLAAVAVLLVPLALAAGWVAQQQQRAWVATSAAAGGVAVVAAWTFLQPQGPRVAWETAAVAVALAGAHHVFVERRGSIAAAASPAALLAAFGQGIVLLVAPQQHPGVPLWPWLAGWLALAALLMRHAVRTQRGPLMPAAAFGVAIGLDRFMALRAGETMGAIAIEGAIAAAIATAIAFQVAAIGLARSSLRSWAEHAAGVFAVVFALALSTPLVARGLDAWILLAASLVLGILVALVATRLALGVWLLAAVGVTAFVHASSTFGVATTASVPLLAPLLLQVAAVLLFTAWPLATGRPLVRDRLALYASALAGPAFFPSILRLFEQRFGDAAIGVVPVALGAFSLIAAHRYQHVLGADAVARRRALVWHLGVAIGFASAAIPLQLDREWITVAWALEGLGLVWLWGRLDHPGLKWTATALFVAVTVRLVANPELLDYHPRGGWPVLNWLLYTYLIPAVALLVAATRLAATEVTRARDFERPLYVRSLPVASIVAGVGGLLVIFAWINLAILDAFAQGSALRLPSDHQPARDLTQSIAWAVYGLALLAVGVRKSNRALRWASLVLVMATVAKVFLHDLGELRDLYRVASLLGLALSLIIVSLAYQRFVLGRVTEQTQ